MVLFCRGNAARAVVGLVQSQHTSWPLWCTWEKLNTVSRCVCVAALCPYMSTSTEREPPLCSTSLYFYSSGSSGAFVCRVYRFDFHKLLDATQPHPPPTHTPWSGPADSLCPPPINIHTVKSVRTCCSGWTVGQTEASGSRCSVSGFCVQCVCVCFDWDLFLISDRKLGSTRPLKQSKVKQ